MGKVNKLGTWVPHQLTSDNIQQRISICFFVVKTQSTQVSSTDLTGDVYVPQRKGQWINPEDLPEPEPKKPASEKSYAVSLVGFRRYYVLRPNTTIDSKLYRTTSKFEGCITSKSSRKKKSSTAP